MPHVGHGRSRVALAASSETVHRRPVRRQLRQPGARSRSAVTRLGQSGVSGCSVSRWRAHGPAGSAERHRAARSTGRRSSVAAGERRADDAARRPGTATGRRTERSRPHSDGLADQPGRRRQAAPARRSGAGPAGRACRRPGWTAAVATRTACLRLYPPAASGTTQKPAQPAAFFRSSASDDPGQRRTKIWPRRCGAARGSPLVVASSAVGTRGTGGSGRCCAGNGRR